MNEIYKYKVCTPETIRARTPARNVVVRILRYVRAGKHTDQLKPKGSVPPQGTELDRINLSLFILLRRALALPLLLWLASCAAGPKQVTQGFSCDMWKDGWATQATLLEYSYGDQVPMLNKKAHDATGLGCGGVSMPMPTADFLYVKWRLNATGQVIEERVDLRGRLPQDMYDHEVTFVIDERQLFVYLVTPTKITKNLPKAPLRAWRSRYRVTYEIYPNNELKR